MNLDVTWIHGATGEPTLQVHRADERTFILRQSKSVTYEAPFLFLLVGDDRALLLDTGATAEPEQFPLRATVDDLIGELPLVVAHSHGHGDHVAADGQFADRPHTTIVGRDLEEVRAFFGFGPAEDRLPGDTVTFELGGRTLSILGSPGHHKSAITIYDPRTGFLLTGDTVIPGRLYAFDYPAFLGTLDRLVAFADEHPVSYVLGCHVEMRQRAGRDFPIGATYHPDERRLEMTVEQLRQVQKAAHEVAQRPGVHRYDDFVIYNEPRQRDLRLLVMRGQLHKLIGRRPR
ncbi:glyoxylase-like metal-dependent hydrolase (beta-lactamase superfamily II) [Hamadaea flava]|uniref:MBL fold metallo-hydrolase n=1 Tax=Hamadaea flava TaxID=1742688 RepID=A0ABV8LRH3_9ACTN|nr:MBL fold metallo-hydrolase [Hamadaea flava]MCP2321872.1 glyoxylase-like metal-dependent hydrolase (beta-lactamase superfamily II) [Hamadaea flava]